MARWISGGSDARSRFELPYVSSGLFRADAVLTPDLMPLTVASTERDPSATGRLERSVQAMFLSGGGGIKMGWGSTEQRV